MKKTLINMTCLTVVTIFAPGCGALFDFLLGEGGTPTKHKSGTGEAKVEAVKFDFDSSVDSKYKQVIEKDLDILADAGLSDPAGSDVLAIPDFRNQRLHDWLSDRVKIVVGEYFSEYFTTEKSGFTYPADNVSPFDGLSPIIEPQVSGVTMKNLGAGAYAQGKEKSRVYSIDVLGKKLIITTPRVAVVKIGGSLLTGRIVSGTDYLDDVNSYFRICTYFHEAKHSDGHGSDTGFLHKKCPPGHSMSGEYACDKYTNGPYSVARVMLSKFRTICDNCNSKEKKAIDLYIADNASRVLDEPVYADPSPESISYP